MMKTRLAIAALVTVGLAGAPIAAEARTQTHFRNHPTRTQQRMYPRSVLNPPYVSYPTSVLNPPSLSYPTSVINH
jgi:hypothetical protein